MPAIVTKPCKKCGRRMLPKNWSRKQNGQCTPNFHGRDYCSKACSKASQYKKKKCWTCQEEYQPHSNESFYCSIFCKELHKLRRNHKGDDGNGLTLEELEIVLRLEHATETVSQQDEIRVTRRIAEEARKISRGWQESERIRRARFDILPDMSVHIPRISRKRMKQKRTRSYHKPVEA